MGELENLICNKKLQKQRNYNLTKMSQLAKSHGGEIQRNGNYWVFAGFWYFQIHTWRERPRHSGFGLSQSLIFSFFLSR
jgi:hypothetical protein